MSEKDEQLLASPASVLMLENNVTAKVGEGGVLLFLTSNRTSSCNLNQGSPYSLHQYAEIEYDRRGDRKTWTGVLNDHLHH